MCGSVDYAICLHDSNSKVDLPIKILDVFACHVPVVAYKYSEAIREVISENHNGFLFENENEMYEIILKILKR